MCDETDKKLQKVDFPLLFFCSVLMITKRWKNLLQIRCNRFSAVTFSYFEISLDIHPLGTDWYLLLRFVFPAWFLKQFVV